MNISERVKEKIKLVISSIVVLLLVVAVSSVLSRNVSGKVNVEVVGDSMQPTLYSGEKLTADKNITQINRGDIIIFKSVDDNKVLIKRVVGLPGEKIRIQNEKIFINNKELAEPYLKEKMNSAMDKYLPVDMLIPIEVYYVMGDNRNNSNDSRNFGVVPMKSIIGKIEK
ncbi:signal peptidase I [Clostridium sp. WLY-B-L2]|uniref:Signal peptidase I n=1 Tax=Clostridium aromativorans TaxID=2836848 RepID=A0ABS8NC70_9CLOT|nr:signal peptidase I [Clostridium aromativorans]MCC9296789.1 signal peptidase I [Clostridium aromativorans]CAB1249257.1 Signal peptidase I [Clostridiaceae bacterium BL-3]